MGVFQSYRSTSMFIFKGGHYGGKHQHVSGVYGLVDPRDPLHIRYVGASKDVAYRLYAHVHNRTYLKSRTPLVAWVDGLKEGGVTPWAYLLEGIGSGKSRDAAERYFITHLKSDLNVRLTGATCKRLHAKNSNLTLQHATRPATCTCVVSENRMFDATHATRG